MRALDDAGIALAHLQLHSPSLDDVFLAKTGRSLEGAGEEGEAGRRGARAGVIAELGHQVGFVARRSVRRTLRQPALIVPTLVFPLFLLAVNSSGLSAATKIPGFPADSYLDFAITVTFIQGAMFAAITAGTELATDIETGFLDRLQLTPLRRVAILIGQMAGATTLALIGALAYLAVGIAPASASRAASAARSCSSSTPCSSPSPSPGSARRWARGRARPRRCRAPSRSCSRVFFLSSMSLPRDLIAVDWFRTVATWNPASYLIEGTALARDHRLGRARRCGAGVAVGVGVLVLSFWAASRALATRMART